MIDGPDAGESLDIAAETEIPAPETEGAAETAAAAEIPADEATEQLEGGDDSAEAEEAAVEGEPPADVAAEHLHDGFIDGDTLVPMSHPDNGSCDAYETDEEGRLLVPAIEVPGMLSHGFTVAAGDQE